MFNWKRKNSIWNVQHLMLVKVQCNVINWNNCWGSRYAFESSSWVHSLSFKVCHHPHAHHYSHHHHRNHHHRHLWSHVAWDKWGLYFKWQRPILNLTLIDNHKCNAGHSRNSVKITVKRQVQCTVLYSATLYQVQSNTVLSTVLHSAKYSVTADTVLSSCYIWAAQ